MPTGAAAFAVARALMSSLPQWEWRGCAVRRDHANPHGVAHFAATGAVERTVRGEKWGDVNARKVSPRGFMSQGSAPRVTGTFPQAGGWAMPMIPFRLGAVRFGCRRSFDGTLSPGLPQDDSRAFGDHMLYSQSMDIGFAHYPKTAGHSLTRWFREVFPDATLVEPHPVYEVNHLPVRDSLEKLGLVQPRRDPSLASCHRLTRACVKLSRTLVRCLPAGLRASIAHEKPCPTRIIGVVREPFEMLVSLFEYWRSFDYAEEPTQPLIRAARQDGFRRFLGMAVSDGGLATYESFSTWTGRRRPTHGCSISMPWSPRCFRSAVNSASACRRPNWAS